MSVEPIEDHMFARTVGGCLAWLENYRKHGDFADSVINPRRNAITRVFNKVHPDAYEAMPLEGMNVREAVTRWANLAGKDDDDIKDVTPRIESTFGAFLEWHDTKKKPEWGSVKRERTPRAPRGGGKASKGGDEPDTALTIPCQYSEGRVEVHVFTQRLHPRDAARVAALVQASAIEPEPEPEPDNQQEVTA